MSNTNDSSASQPTRPTWAAEVSASVAALTRPARHGREEVVAREAWPLLAEIPEATARLLYEWALLRAGVAVDGLATAVAARCRAAGLRPSGKALQDVDALVAARAADAELIAALRGLVAAHNACRGWGDRPHGNWTRLEQARAAVREAEARTAGKGDR